MQYTHALRPDVAEHMQVCGWIDCRAGSVVWT